MYVTSYTNTKLIRSHTSAAFSLTYHAFDIITLSDNRDRRSSNKMDGCEERTAIPILRQQQELTVDFLAGLDEDQGEESSETDLGEVTLRQSKV